MGGSFRDPEDHPSERRAQEPRSVLRSAVEEVAPLMKMLALALFVVTLTVPSTHAADLDRTAVDFKTPAEITWVRNDRFFVVVSGTWWMGTGERFDPASTVAAPAGSYVIHYGGKVHYDGAKDEETIIQVWGMGPATATPAEKR